MNDKIGAEERKEILGRLADLTQLAREQAAKLDMIIAKLDWPDS